MALRVRVPSLGSQGAGFVSAWALGSNTVLGAGAHTMKKNVASQAIGVQMVSATTGAAFTSAVTVSVTGDAGTQATGSVGSGACTHEGNGFHTYAPAQAETNYDHIGFTFTGTGAVPVTVQVYPTYPQTGDNFPRIGSPVGASISADIAGVQSDTDNIQTRIPAALVSGRIDASVGAMAANTLTATAIASDAITDAKVASDVTIASITGNVGGNVVGSVGSVTGLTASNLDATISSRASQTSVDTIDDFVDTEVAAIKAKTDNLPSDPADASDIASSFSTVNSTLSTIAGYIDTEVAAIKAKTDQLTFTIANTVDANTTYISGSSAAADNLEAGAEALIETTCAVGSTTTAIVTNLTEATDDHYNGRVITFTTGILTGQASNITDYNGTTKTLTVTALTEAPSNTDTFVIS